MINELQIENYKSIRQLRMNMRSINVLIGSNGAGKSNFISFFKFLKNIYDTNLQGYVASEGSSEDLLHFGSKTSEYIFGYLEFDNIISYVIKLYPNADNKLFIDFEQVTVGHDLQSMLGFNVLSQNLIESELKTNKSRKNMIELVQTFMDSFRVFHFHDTSKTSGLRKPAKTYDNYFLREDGSNLPAFLYWIQEKHPKNFQKIEMQIRSVAPYFDSFLLNPEKINEDQIHLRWKEKGSDAYFAAKHLSDGTLRFIALVTLLLQPEAPKVIIIDEPELGLHPSAIYKLASLIKKVSNNTQFILSTQSSNLVDNFEPEDIITVDRKDNQSTFTRHTTEELKNWLEKYSLGDLWNKNVIGGRP